MVTHDESNGREHSKYRPCLAQDYKILTERAVIQCGTANQIVKSIEELSELVFELSRMLNNSESNDKARAIGCGAKNIEKMCKQFREGEAVLVPDGEWKLDHLMSELVDASIMIDIMRVAFKHRKMFDVFEEYKIERMRHRLDEMTITPELDFA